jgi:hypothetical protein
MLHYKPSDSKGKKVRQSSPGLSLSLFLQGFITTRDVQHSYTWLQLNGSVSEIPYSHNVTKGTDI